MNKILITGVAGFIGFHLAQRLLNIGFEVLGIDNLSDYYDISIKNSRLKVLGQYKTFLFIQEDICNRDKIFSIFNDFKPNIVFNLAAQAGVRYSMINPSVYIETNIVGFHNVLEASVKNKVKHFIFASSSSVYGCNVKMPFSVKDHTEHPMSLYAATKKSNEMIAHSYSSMYDFPCTGVRFFSAYGPYGRPDLALYIFTKNILEGKPINVFGDGTSTRAYTYIDDTINSLIMTMRIQPYKEKYWTHNPSASIYPYQLFNIGSNKPVTLDYFISLIEQNLNTKATKNYLPVQVADIQEAFADIDNDLFEMKTTIEEGVKLFVDWFKSFYNYK